MSLCRKSLVTLLFSSCFVSFTALAQEQMNSSDEGEEIIILETEENVADDEVIILEDASDTASGETSDKTSDEMIVIEEPAADEAVIQIEESELEVVSEDEIVIDNTQPALASAPESDSVVIRLEDVWLEASTLTVDNTPTDELYYAHATVSAEWNLNPSWEVKITGRLDGHKHSGGDPEWDDVDADYGETYIRFRGEASRVTVGAQKVIWGRIDELPPSDRLSTVDATRLVLDDLQDRRRARPMLRVEAFSGDSKFDFIYMPTFREAELAAVDSIWYPINRAEGKVLGIEVNPLIAAAMPTSTIVNDEPDSDHAVGLRYSSTLEDIDYALTVQHGRQTLPYFSYDAATNTFYARYPRSLAVGGDFGFESEGITWRFEGAYISDVPVTTKTGRYNEVEGLNLAAGMEFYPGDGDTRVNLQLVTNHLLDADNVIERENVYNFNGSVDIPFAENRWNANTRFFIDLEEGAVYINPEIAFVGWEPHELYLEAHYFDGEEGTLGGFHEDHSLLTVGWRAKF